MKRASITIIFMCMAFFGSAQNNSFTLSSKDSILYSRLPIPITEAKVILTGIHNISCKLNTSFTTRNKSLLLQETKRELSRASRFLRKAAKKRNLNMQCSYIEKSLTSLAFAQSAYHDYVKNKQRK